MSPSSVRGLYETCPSRLHSDTQTVLGLSLDWTSQFGRTPSQQSLSKVRVESARIRGGSVKTSLSEGRCSKILKRDTLVTCSERTLTQSLTES